MKREQKERTRASKIVMGEIEPEENEKYLLNLRKRKPFNEWDKGELHKVAVMGGKAVQELHGERRSAKQALENVLTLKITDDIVNMADIDESIVNRVRRSNPNATLYDLIQAVAVGKALDGSIRAAEYVRDTNGDKPKEQIEISDVMTESDRELLESISKRMKDGDRIEIVRDITE